MVSIIIQLICSITEYIGKQFKTECDGECFNSVMSLGNILTDPHAMDPVLRGEQDALFKVVLDGWDEVVKAEKTKKNATDQAEKEAANKFLSDFYKG